MRLCPDTSRLTVYQKLFLAEECTPKNFVEWRVFSSRCHPSQQECPVCSSPSSIPSEANQEVVKDFGMFPKFFSSRCTDTTSEEEPMHSLRCILVEVFAAVGS